MSLVIVDTRDLKRAAKALRKHANGKVLAKELRDGIRKATDPVVPAVRAAYGGGVKLRPALARATRREVRTGGAGAGVRVRVDGRKMPAGMGSLPGYREGISGNWRHPVFGNREVWVSQAPVPVFYRTVEPFAEHVHRELDRVAVEVAAKIAND